MEGKAEAMRNEAEENVEKHQRWKECVASTIKRIKCSLWSQEPYGALSNSKSDAESIEVQTAKGSEEYNRFWEIVLDLK